MISLHILIEVIQDGLKGIKKAYFTSRRDKFGYIHPTAKIYQPTYCVKGNTYLYKNAKIGENSQINNHKGKFFLKENSRSGMFLTVICQNHEYNNIGGYPGDKNWYKEIADDVIVEEDVWIGTNVVICPGVHIGRGSVVAAGSVCIKSHEYPPYSIIGGNPAKFIKFKFSLEEQIKHESIRFKQEERLSINALTDNWNRFSK